MKEKKLNKKLIEVAIPLDAINYACIKESSVTWGHPSAMHQWWARRRLAACRAVLFTSLIDDPGEYLPAKEAKKERKRLFKLIEKFVLWENTDNDLLWKQVNKEIKKSIGDKTPMIVDPFCGGGSIPLEAQRMGLKTFASDLNPIPVLITKTLIEIPSKFKKNQPVNPTAFKQKKEVENLDGLVADLKFYGNFVNEEVKKKIGKLYPKINNANVAIWLWTRTITCPNPICKSEIPLARSFKIGKLNGKPVYVKIKYNNTKKAKFEITFKAPEYADGTVSKKNGVTCTQCNQSVKLDYARKEARSGRMKPKLMAILKEASRGFEFLAPTEEHEKIAFSAKPTWVPSTDIPDKALGFRVQAYGMTKHKDVHSMRQLTALSTFSDVIINTHKKIQNDAVKAGLVDDEKALRDNGDGATAYADAIVTYLYLALSRCVNYWSTLTPWGGSFIVQMFNRHALPIVWDFAEGNPFSNRTGNWTSAVEWIIRCFEKSISARTEGEVEQLDASATIKQSTNMMICTDPPYFANIGYADLSDFFYVWARRTLGKIYPDLFSTVLTPKQQEIIASEIRFGDDATQHFIDGLTESFKLFKEHADEDFPITIFYAYKEKSAPNSKTPSGWESMLSSLISAKLQIVGTWPMRTDKGDSGMKTGTNSLASSIILVCRKISEDASMISKKEFVSLLRKDLPMAINVFKQTSIAPVDLTQSVIGPGMAIFSRYSKVLEADGSSMNIRNALSIINHELDSCMTASESDLDSHTRFCLSWFEQFGFMKGSFGDADVLSRAKNTSIADLVNQGLVESGGGKVNLISYNDFPDEIDITKIEPLSIWNLTHHLIKKFGTSGEEGVAEVIKKIGSGTSEKAKDLAYNLYSTCDKKDWSDHALAYNSLVSSWSSIQNRIGLASVPEGQTRL